MVSRSPEKDALYIMTVKKKQCEYLHNYLAYFNKAMLEIPSLEKGVAIEAIKQRMLSNSSFYLPISKQKLISFE